MKKEKLIRNQLLWGILVLVLVAVAAIWTWNSFVEYQSRRLKPLPVYGRVPEFSLIERSGRPLGLSDLQGKIWIADFIFTNCQGTCPLMSSQMSALQISLDRADDVLLVSFSVDPERDTPEVLSAYADHYRAKQGQWLFLTGEKGAIYRLSKEGFHLGVGDNFDRNPDAPDIMDLPIVHSLRFALVDRQGQIRGYYHSTDTQLHQRILTDVGVLLKEESI